MAPILDHIAQRQGVSVEKARELLDGFTRDLRVELDRSGSASVRGLGEFRLVDGELEFEPEPRLATVVNHRFAGLSPLPVAADEDASLGLTSGFGVPEVPFAAGLPTEVPDPEAAAEQEIEPSAEPEPTGDEVSGSQQSSIYYALDDEDEPDLGDSTAPWAKTTDVVDSVRSEVELEEDVDEWDEPSAGVPAPEPGSAERSEETGDHPSGAWNRPARFQEPEVPDHEIDDDYRAESAFHREADETPDFGGTLVHPAHSPQTKPSVSDEDVPPPVNDAVQRQDLPGTETAGPDAGAEAPVVVRSPKVSRGYWLVIPVLIVAIGIVLWLLSQSEREPDPAGQRQTQLDADESRPPDAAGDAAPDAAELASQSQGSGTEAAAASAADAPWQPGQVNKRAGGYTIIVSSQATESEAIEFARNLVAGVDRGIPIDLYKGTARGRTRYRVGVGQFESIEIAIGEMDRLAPQLPAGAWILRIRRDM